MSLSFCWSYHVSSSLWTIIRKITCVSYSSTVLGRRRNQKSPNYGQWHLFSCPKICYCSKPMPFKRFLSSASWGPIIKWPVWGLKSKHAPIVQIVAPDQIVHRCSFRSPRRAVGQDSPRQAVFHIFGQCGKSGSRRWRDGVPRRTDNQGTKRGLWWVWQGEIFAFGKCWNFPHPFSFSSNYL